VGDVNADGKGDIAVGADSEDVGASVNQGRAYVFSGADGSLLHTLDTPSGQAYAYLGLRTAVGDVDGDGKGDIAVGAYQEDVGANVNQGRAYVFSGADGSLLFTLDTPNPQSPAYFGVSVAIGDVNGDGKGDVAVGATVENVGGNRGRAYVFSGVDGSVLLTLDPPNPQPDTAFGRGMAIGDVNGDGNGDIAVGAPIVDVGANADQGQAYVFSGVGGSLLFTVDTPNPQASVSFGMTVAVGDANGDGKGDVATGAAGEDVGANPNQGRAYVFSSPLTEETVTVEVGPGEAATTDTESDGATAWDPVETSVTTPNAGTVSINETAITGTPPPGFQFLGQQISITAPPATAEVPLVIVFTLDSSKVPPGQNQNTVQIARGGALVAACAGSPGTASPDPCISNRALLPEGDIAITVLTSTASTWNVASPAQSSGSVGGIAELPEVAQGSGSGPFGDAALAVGAAAGFVVLAAGAWYARRRLVG
jgi:hypothetical protein